MEATLLIGAISALAMEAYKALSKKFGTKATKHAILIGVFAIALGWTILIQEQIISTEAVSYFVKAIMTSVGIYEVIIKNAKKFLGLASKD